MNQEVAGLSPEKESTHSGPKPATRFEKSLRGAMRWALVSLLMLGLGALLIALTLYFPTRQKLEQSDASLKQANAKITSQTSQVTGLQADNQGLKKSLDSASLHTSVLSALSGVRGASLAVAASDSAGASLSFSQASAALDALSPKVGADQKAVLGAMQKSAIQISTELKTDLKSAQPGLDQLTKNLVQLEDNLFPTH